MMAPLLLVPKVPILKGTTFPILKGSFWNFGRIWREKSLTFNQASFAPQSVQIPGPRPLGGMV